MKAAILTIGNEVLTGKTLNTNSQFLARSLTSQGYDVVCHLTIEDEQDIIVRHVRGLLGEVDLLVTTGGLGPTYDDLTITSLANALETPLEFHPEILADITEKFKRFHTQMTDNNRQQAYLIEGSEVLKNAYGTAPGMYFRHAQGILIALPGPPNENIPMFENEVVPRLQSLGNGAVHLKDVVIYGMGESTVEELFRTRLPQDEDVRVATYVKPRYVIIRLTSRSEQAIQRQLTRIHEIFGDKVLGEDDTNLENWVIDNLKAKSMTLSLAESCTGGMIASHLVNVAGASDVFDRSLVTYSNRAKTEELGVPETTLDTYGAVSEETARAMAVGLLERSGSDICLAVTGIAGPGGGTEEKPVGLTWFAVATPTHVHSKAFTFFGDRESIRHRATLTALNLIRKELLEKLLDR